MHERPASAKAHQRSSTEGNELALQGQGPILGGAPGDLEGQGNGTRDVEGNPTRFGIAPKSQKRAHEAGIAKQLGFIAAAGRLGLGVRPLMQ